MVSNMVGAMSELIVVVIVDVPFVGDGNPADADTKEFELVVHGQFPLEGCLLWCGRVRTLTIFPHEQQQID